MEVRPSSTRAGDAAISDAVPDGLCVAGVGTSRLADFDTYHSQPFRHTGKFHLANRDVRVPEFVGKLLALRALAARLSFCVKRVNLGRS